MNDFEKWKRRPVYIVQCYTIKIARSMSLWCANSVFYFRAKREFRDEATQLLRSAVASKLREMRNKGLITAKTVRKDHDLILQKTTGNVWVGDLDEVLKRGEIL